MCIQLMILNQPTMQLLAKRKKAPEARVHFFGRCTHIYFIYSLHITNPNQFTRAFGWYLWDIPLYWVLGPPWQQMSNTEIIVRSTEIINVREYESTSHIEQNKKAKRCGSSNIKNGLWCWKREKKNTRITWHQKKKKMRRENTKLRLWTCSRIYGCRLLKRCNKTVTKRKMCAPHHIIHKQQCVFAQFMHMLYHYEYKLRRATTNFYDGRAQFGHFTVCQHARNYVNPRCSSNVRIEHY